MTLQYRVRFKADDIWDAPDDGKTYEVIDGGLYVTPAPGWAHQQALAVLFGYLWQYIWPRRLGRLTPAPTGVALDDENGVQPDIVYISREREHLISERGVEGAPDLVVEVLSPSTQARDRGIKMRRYANSGVPHCWLVVPETRSLEAYALAEQGYELTGVYGPGETFRPALFPGLEVPIDELWA